MNNLVAFGDSFTWGSELKDSLDKFDKFNDFNNLSNRDIKILSQNTAGPFFEKDFNHNYKSVLACHSKNTWSALLAEHLKLAYICHAKPGCSNETILRKLIQYIPNISSNDFVVINWTYIDRWDFVDPTALPIDTQWTTITPTNKNKSSFEKFYFKYIQSELLHKWESLRNILLAIKVLKEKNIKFLMTCTDKLILDQTYHAPSYIKNIQAEIVDYIIWFEELGFDDWCTKHKFPRGKENNHPLEEAHIAAFEYIKENYDFTK